MKDLLDIMKSPVDSTNLEFDSIQISLASPDTIKSWSHGEVKNLKPSITVPLNQNVMVYFVPKFLVQSKTMNVFVANTNVVNSKALSVKNVA